MDVLPLGSYDIRIAMGWLEARKIKLDFYNKASKCLDEEGKLRMVRGISKDVFGRIISVMQLKKLCRKRCQLYAAHVLEAAENGTPRMEDFHVLQEIRNVFPDKFLRLPPERNIDFTIDSVPGTTPRYKTPHGMSIPKLLKTRKQLQELLGRKDGIIKLCIDYIQWSKVTVKNKIPFA